MALKILSYIALPAELAGEPVYVNTGESYTYSDADTRVTSITTRMVTNRMFTPRTERYIVSYLKNQGWHDYITIELENGWKIYPKNLPFISIDNCEGDPLKARNVTTFPMSNGSIPSTVVGTKPIVFETVTYDKTIGSSAQHYTTKIGFPAPSNYYPPKDNNRYFLCLTASGVQDNNDIMTAGGANLGDIPDGRDVDWSPYIIYFESGDAGSIYLLSPNAPRSDWYYLAGWTERQFDNDKLVGMGVNMPVEPTEYTLIKQSSYHYYKDSADALALMLSKRDGHDIEFDATQYNEVGKVCIKALSEPWDLIDVIGIAAQVRPEGAGTVSGVGFFPYGTQVTLTATPNAGYSFLHWEDAQGNIVSNLRQYSLTATETRIFVAVFSSGVSLTLTSSPLEGGTTRGQGNYSIGDLVSCTASPASNYSFLRWERDGTQVSTLNPYTFNITEDTALTAVFQTPPAVFCEFNNPQNVPDTTTLPCAVGCPAGGSPWYVVGGGGAPRSGSTISYGSLPNISATDTGFVTTYRISLESLKNLSKFMWTTDISNLFYKAMSNPMDVIQSIAVTYENPHDYPDPPVNIKIGNLPASYQGVDVIGNVVQQYKIEHIADIHLVEAFGSFLDYSPYTQASIYLPYIGMFPLDIDALQGGTLSISRRIDFLTGAVAYSLRGTRGGVSTYHEQPQGNCFSQLPLSEQAGLGLSDLLVKALGIAGSAVATVVTGGSAAVVGMGAASAGVGAVMDSKPSYRGTGVSPDAVLLTQCNTCYIVMESPQPVNPTQYGALKGYPCNQSGTIGSFRGFTVCETVKLENITGATDSELEELSSILQGGIFI